MFKLVVALCLGCASAFVAPATMQQRSRVSEVSMIFGNKASPTKPTVTKNAKPLSPGSNYPTTPNIQIQKNGFGTWLQKFQTTSGKSKYGMPIFLPNGNVNPAYLAAERKEAAQRKVKNIRMTENKRQ